MSRKPKIAVLGSLNYDCVVYGDRLPKKGETVIGNGNGFFFGGKGGNQAVQAARLGAQVYFIGRVGKDDIGSKMISALEIEGINTDHIIMDDSTSSGGTAIFVDENGDNAIMVAPNANLKVTKSDIDAAMPVIKECDIFISQVEISVDAIEYALEQVHKAGVMVILNPAPADRISSDVFKYVDYLTPNESEAQVLSGILPDTTDKNSCANASKKLLDLGAKNIIITLGSSGSYFANNETRFLVEAFKIDAVDTTAAGDAFNAGFAYKIAEGENIRDAILFANATGAVSASNKGAQSSLKYKPEIEDFLEKRRD